MQQREDVPAGSGERAAAQDALVEALSAVVGPAAVAPDGRVARLEQNLVPDIGPLRLAAVRRQLAAGGGGELQSGNGLPPKLYSAFSSTALTVNSFGRWLWEEDGLELAGVSGFNQPLAFERRCSPGIPGKTHNLDVVVQSDHCVVAVESKCTEQMAGHEAHFCEAYAPRVRELAHASWRAEYESLRNEPRRYRWLDAAQLIKHYLGLRSTFSQPRIMLVYLYWEPLNGRDVECVREHRTEVGAFSSALCDDRVQFHAQSYLDLWDAWGTAHSPQWLVRYVANLRLRYEVALHPPEG